MFALVGWWGSLEKYLYYYFIYNRDADFSGLKKKPKFNILLNYCGFELFFGNGGLLILLLIFSFGYLLL